MYLHWVGGYVLPTDYITLQTAALLEYSLVSSSNTAIKQREPPFRDYITKILISY